MKYFILTSAVAFLLLSLVGCAALPTVAPAVSAAIPALLDGHPLVSLALNVSYVHNATITTVGGTNPSLPLIVAKSQTSPK